MRKIGDELPALRRLAIARAVISLLFFHRVLYAMIAISWKFSGAGEASYTESAFSLGLFAIAQRRLGLARWWPVWLSSNKSAIC